MAERVRVLVVDDQAPFRTAAKLVIELIDGFDVVGEASSGEDALARLGDDAADLVVMDINLPGIDGIEATRQLLARRPETVVILVSTYRDDELPEDAPTSGALAYVHKERFEPELLEALWASRNDAGWRIA
ncbi:MAG: response regulator transcription factor [Acidimicrobiia bacterium]|nr:response regulator transcription factor [Acidimicrobiia bacterium]